MSLEGGGSMELRGVPTAQPTVPLRRQVLPRAFFTLVTIFGSQRQWVSHSRWGLLPKMLLFRPL